MELEESEDVEKINRAAKGWGQREREGAGGMFTGLCARAERRVGLQRNSAEEASTGGAGAPRTARLYFQSGVCHSPSRAHKPSLAGVCDGRLLG